MSGGRRAARTSHTGRRRYAIVFAVAILAAIAGGWLGEGPAPRLSLLPIALLMVFAGAAYAAAPRRSNALKICWAAVVAAVFAAAWFAGAASATRAYNACIGRGEEIRAALTAYHDRHGRYPGALRDLRMPNSSCRRVLRGDLLVYQPTGSGYSLHFSDGIVQHRATQHEPFIAVK